MRALAFGLLCVLPLVALYAWRDRTLRHRMDARARRAFRLQALGFLALSAAILSALMARRGAVPLPLDWVLLLVLLAVVPLLRVLRTR